MKTLKSAPFRKLVETEPDLVALRKKHSSMTPKKRWLAAQWQYDSEAAMELFPAGFLESAGMSRSGRGMDAGVLSLAIDPLHAPSLLTVGSMEYQHGRRDEAMRLFLALVRLPADEPDLIVIIDKAGDFLIASKDYGNALALYEAAESVYPGVGTYLVGSGYCLGKLGRLDESLRKHRVAVELEPENHKHLNDLGFTLYEMGMLDEAEQVLLKAQKLSPPGYEFPKNNLERLYAKKKVSRKDKKGGRRK